jgi:hypothetical protein
MDDELLRDCETTRYQFLKLDLKTLRTSLEMGDFALGRGNLELAAREEAAVAKGIETIERLAADVSEEMRREVEAGLAVLKTDFRAYQGRLAGSKRE